MSMVMAISKMRARRIETVQGGRNWDDDELAQCLSRPLGGVILSWSAFKAVIYCILSPWRCCKQAYEGSVSEVIACRTIYRAWTTQRFELSVEPGKYPSFASSAKFIISTAAQPRPKQVYK
jgi:hypothetical protein